MILALQLQVWPLAWYSLNVWMDVLVHSWQGQRMEKCRMMMRHIDSAKKLQRYVPYTQNLENTLVVCKRAS